MESTGSNVGRDGDVAAGRRGDHPVNRLIRDLIARGAIPSTGQAKEIREHVADAPFGQRLIPIDEPLVGGTYLGQAIREREPSSFAHLLKRVLIDRQWAAGTTESQYLGDLRKALRLPQARLGLTFFAQTYLVVAVARTDDVIEASRRGPRAGPNLVIFYSANSGILTSGHQMSDAQVATKLRGVRWLN